MVCDNSEKFWRALGWSLAVTDENGLELFGLDLVANGPVASFR